MRFWVSGSALAGNVPRNAQRLPSGAKAQLWGRELRRGLSPCLLKNLVHLGETVFLVAVVCVIADARMTQQKAALAPKVAAHKANERTLAGLRPGKDSIEHAVNLNRQFNKDDKPRDGEFVWFDHCRDASLTVDSDAARKIQEIRVAPWGGSTADCAGMPPGPWKTGLGLRLADSTVKVTQLYGAPDSKSPSSKGGQQLELWYYAFDWAGPDVPQVMEVLCTADEGGKPGRVVEITLAAPSL
jgi:hypothetical protein